MLISGQHINFPFFDKLLCKKKDPGTRHYMQSGSIQTYLVQQSPVPLPRPTFAEKAEDSVPRDEFVR